MEENKTIKEEIKTLEEAIVPTGSVVGVGTLSSLVFATMMASTATYLGYIDLKESIGIGTIIFSTCTSVSLLIALVNYVDNKETKKRIKTLEKKKNK